MSTDREPIAPGDARYYEPRLVPPDGAEPDRAAEFERAKRAEVEQARSRGMDKLPTDVKVLQVRLRHAQEDAAKAGALADAVMTENERLRWALDQVRIRLAMHMEDFPGNRLFPGSKLVEGTWVLVCDALDGRDLDRHR